MKKIIVVLLAFFIGQGCRESKPANKPKSKPKTVTEIISAPDTLAKYVAAVHWDTSSYELDESNVYETQEENSDADEQTGLQGTGIQFPNFSLVFHDFYGGYQFGCYEEWQSMKSNDGGMLICTQDTLCMSEELFDQRINNTLIQVIPKYLGETYKVAFCYLGNLNEVIDHRNLPQAEWEKLYAKALRFKEQTKYYDLPDSAYYYFRALPHTPDMVEIKVQDGKIVPVKSNTAEQINWEIKQYTEDLVRIKKKYNLKDTTVVIPGEYSTYIDLTRDRRLFAYGYEAFLFRIERYMDSQKLETKYVRVYIAYGC